MRSKAETCIQLWLEYAGQLLDGPETLKGISLSRKDHSTVTIHIDLCAKSSDMDQIMEANLPLSPCKPTSQSQSSLDSSQSIFARFPLISVGTDGPTINSNGLDTLLHLLDERDGSLEDVMIQGHNEKGLRIILKVPLLIS